MSCPTTRRYPRTMREAFPRDVDHACAVERPRGRFGMSLADLAMAVLIACLLAAVLLHGMDALVL